MLRFNDLRKSFGTKQVLRGISLNVEPGQIVFILGTSGTGKSVLLKTVVGLLRPDSGEVWLDNMNVTSLSELELGQVRKKCGMVFQHPALFDSLSIFENVAFGLRRHYELTEDEIGRRVRQSLARVQVNGIESQLPQEISYGTQKRVSLARTLAVGPEVLLFDEPTTGLDPITTNAINDLIQELSRELKTTSLVVSHDMHCALAIADHIVFLDQGQILEQGSPAELKRSQQPLVQSFLAEALEATDA